MYNDEENTIYGIFEIEFIIDLQTVLTLVSLKYYDKLSYSTLRQLEALSLIRVHSRIESYIKRENIREKFEFKECCTLSVNLKLTLAPHKNSLIHYYFLLF